MVCEPARKTKFLFWFVYADATERHTVQTAGACEAFDYTGLQSVSCQTATAPFSARRMRDIQYARVNAWSLAVSGHLIYGRSNYYD